MTNDAFLDHGPPNWLAGRGRSPQLNWHVEIPGGLAELVHAREAGDFFAASQTGHLFRIDRNGEIRATKHFDEPLRLLRWSDEGTLGAVVLNETTVVRLSRSFEIVRSITFTEPVVGLAISPFGNHLAVSLADGTVSLFSNRKRPIAQFDAQRPLRFLEFCPAEATLFGAAEHNYLCCYNLAGAPVWEQNLWSNVGRLRLTGYGELIYLAAFGHGVQCFDGDGQAIGTYAIEGTTSRIDCSFQPGHIIAATIERTLHRMNSNGDLLWSTTVDDDIAELICDPLESWAVCGFASQGLYCLDWSRSSPSKN